MAVAYWNLLLTERFKFLDLWNRFLLVSSEPRTSILFKHVVKADHWDVLYNMTVLPQASVVKNIAACNLNSVFALTNSAKVGQLTPLVQFTHIHAQNTHPRRMTSKIQLFLDLCLGAPQAVHPERHVEPAAGLWQYDCRRHVQLWWGRWGLANAHYEMHCTALQWCYIFVILYAILYTSAYKMTHTGAWPVLIDDFVEFARPIVTGGSRKSI